MDNLKHTICSKCKKSVPVSDVKYAQDKKSSPVILCSSCRGGNSKEVEIKAGSRKSEQQIKKSYNCSRCNYDFKVKPSISHQKEIACPYCGKSDRIKENKIISISSIINNLD
ncbi:MAG: hypothetical protein ISS82_01390 [Nanoarchaeota archaeon]|nr:hypothetical protein [Nanoarchaeota archaeon]